MLRSIFTFLVFHGNMPCCFTATHKYPVTDYFGWRLHLSEPQRNNDTCWPAETSCNNLAWMKLEICFTFSESSQCYVPTISSKPAAIETPH